VGAGGMRESTRPQDPAAGNRFIYLFQLFISPCQTPFKIKVTPVPADIDPIGWN
jgi:hypothetical protein